MSQQFLHVKIQDLDGFTKTRGTIEHGEFSTHQITVRFTNGPVVGTLIANGTLCIFESAAAPILNAQHIPYYRA